MSGRHTGSKRGMLVVAFLAGGAAVAAISGVALRAQPAPATAPAASEVMNARITAKSPVQVGKYIVLIAGCNDCHTPGYMQQGRAIPEELWLTGLPVGFRGAWGTTYPPNLRIFTAKYKTADEFVQVLRARNVRPPMPWESLHAMSDSDLRALYAYIKSLPVTGTAAPEYVSPGAEPKTPYIPFEPVLPVGMNPPAPAK